MKSATIPAIVVLLTICPSQTLFAQQAATRKKLIEWGWDEPDTQFMRKNIRAMERLPFDGVVFHVLTSAGDKFVWEMWGSRRFTLAEVQHAIDDLKATPFERFTDRFLRVNVTPGTVDWFDDQAWTVVLDNFSLAAQIAKQGGCKGFVFDAEQYKGLLFSYEKQKHCQTKTFPEYQAQVRQRGREWMRAVNSQYPEITILLPYAYCLAGPLQTSPVKDMYRLLGDFLDGMLDVCTPQTRLVDGWEGAYRYRDKKQFAEAYRAIRVKLARQSGLPDKYRRHFEAGFGIWLDCYTDRVITDASKKKKRWHTDDLTLNYFTPTQFENSVRWALETSDQYVWIYTQSPRWWTSERLPQPYVDALTQARRSQALELPHPR